MCYWTSVYILKVVYNNIQYRSVYQKYEALCSHSDNDLKLMPERNIKSRPVLPSELHTCTLDYNAFTLKQYIS